MMRSTHLHWALVVALPLCLCASLLAQDKPQLEDEELIPQPVPACSLDKKLDANHGVEVLSDTRGVAFGTYLRHMAEQVRTNWYALIPQAAYPPVREKGVVALSFRILKDGSVAQLKFVCKSGDIALDRAAYAAVNKSTPFSSLPREFQGDYLALRMTFAYNPDRKKPDKTPPQESQK